MLAKTLFTMMPEVERFAQRDVPKKKQGTAVQFALRLVRLREAWAALDKVRVAMVSKYERDEDGTLKPADAQELSETWTAALDQELEDFAPIMPVDGVLDMAPEASAGEIAALIQLGLCTPDAGETCACEDGESE